jgi:hypothetical protein
MGAADEQQEWGGEQALPGEANGRMWWLSEERAAEVAALLRRPADAGEEVQWRLLAIRAVLERESRALARRGDGRLLDVLVEIDELKLSIARTLREVGSAKIRGLDS